MNMSDQGKVSIVIPSYNRKMCIKDSIDSVVSQTYEDWKLTIVDNNSNDGTYDFIVEEYKTHINNKKIENYKK